jgi:hypothetical protein
MKLLLLSVLVFLTFMAIYGMAGSSDLAEAERYGAVRAEIKALAPLWAVTE